MNMEGIAISLHRGDACIHLGDAIGHKDADEDEGVGGISPYFGVDGIADRAHGKD